jgi:hypothetical protein
MGHVMLRRGPRSVYELVLVRESEYLAYVHARYMMRYDHVDA